MASVMAQHRLEEIEGIVGILPTAPKELWEGIELETANGELTPVTRGVYMDMSINLLPLITQGAVVKNILFLIPDKTWIGTSVLVGKEVFDLLGIKDMDQLVYDKIGDFRFDCLTGNFSKSDGLSKLVINNVKTYGKENILDEDEEIDLPTFEPPILSMDDDPKMLKARIVLALERSLAKAIAEGCCEETVVCLKELVFEFVDVFRIKFLPKDKPIDHPPYSETLPSDITPEQRKQMRNMSLRRYSHEASQAMDEAMGNLIATGMVSVWNQSTDPHSIHCIAPCVPVLKDNPDPAVRKFRLAWDLRLGNSFLQRHPIPTENIDSLFQGINGNSFFSADALSSFWQIAVHPATAQFNILSTA